MYGCRNRAYRWKHVRRGSQRRSNSLEGWFCRLETYGLSNSAFLLSLYLLTRFFLVRKRTCHNWGDEKCLKLLKNCHEALKDNGKLIIVDSIMPKESGSSLVDKYVSHYDNIMFTQHEGKERTEEEFRALGKEAGFSDFRVVCSACAHCVMELRK